MFDFNHKYDFPFYTPNLDCLNIEFHSNEEVVAVDKNHSLKNKILQLIRNSKNNLKICSFLLDDQEVYTEILYRLRNDQLPIFIVTNLNENQLNTDYLKIYDDFNYSIANHIENIKNLYRAGAHIRAGEDLHAKFIISDFTKIIITSANLSPFCLNKNNEVGIIILAKEQIKILNQVFDIIYRYYTTYPAFAESLIQKMENIKLKDLLKISPKPDRITYTLGENTFLYNSIIKLVSLANKEIYICSYNLNKLTNLTELFNALENKSKSGIKIKLFLRAKDRVDMLKDINTLLDIGVDIYADNYNHAKGILVDDSNALFFTANIDGQHGLKSGFEVGFKIRQDEYINKFNEYIKFLFMTAPYKVVKNPSYNQISEFYKISYKSKGIRSNNFFVDSISLKSKRENFIKSLFNELRKNIPYYYTDPNHNYVLLETEKNKFYKILKKSNQEYYLEGINKKNTFRYKHFLDVKNINII